MKLYTRQARNGYFDVDKNKYLDKIRRSLQSEIFLKYITNKENRILDIGCGSGKFLKILATYGFQRTFGVEPDRHLIDGLLAEFPEFEDRIKYSGATCLPFDDCSFDCVYFFNVMHHLQGTPDYLKAINEAHRVLVEGGILIMIEPCNSFIYSLKRNFARMLSPFSSFWSNMYNMMFEERELMEMYIAHSDGVCDQIKSSGFNVIRYTKHFHQSVIVAHKHLKNE